tara:strand:- start:397 stop:843 length:447 start_codon:yes stop_codon:yes gene_type:complete
MAKTSEDHQSNSRLGALGESLVQSFLLEYADWCYLCQEKHPADLLVEFGNAKYSVQVKSRRESKEGKYTFASETSRSMSDVYKNYHCDILAFVFFSEDHRRIIFKPNASSQTYFTFDSKIITPTLEIDSLKETLGVLSSVPVINSLFE